MAEGKERSLLFNVLYVVMRVIFFPVSMVLYVLKHPLWVMGVLLIAGCVLVYYPMSTGVSLEDVPMWYRGKYTKAKLEVISVAVQNGRDDIFSRETLKELEDEYEESQGLKSEGYNAKIVRDEKIQEKTSTLKKRGGFKRKGGDVSVLDEKDGQAKIESDKAVSGGLEAIFQAHLDTEMSEEVALPMKETKEVQRLEKPIIDAAVPQSLPQKQEDKQIFEQGASEVVLPKTTEKAPSEVGLDDFDLF